MFGATCPYAERTTVKSDTDSIHHPVSDGNAVMVRNHRRAADAIRAAHMANLGIPSDIAVLGVDDDELICEHTIPPLSSVKTDAEGMGDAAAQMMLTLLGGKGKQPSPSPPLHSA